MHTMVEHNPQDGVSASISEENDIPIGSVDNVSPGRLPPPPVGSPPPTPTLSRFEPEQPPTMKVATFPTTPTLAQTLAYSNHITSTTI
jgi:hypothetical protein